MNLTAPYPADLLRVARKVVWYDSPEQTLADLMTFLAHLMVYGSAADVLVAERYVPAEEFRRILEDAPAGVFTQEAWEKWHEQLGMPAPPLPRRHFPDGSLVRRPGVSLVGSGGAAIPATPLTRVERGVGLQGRGLSWGRACFFAVSKLCLNVISSGYLGWLSSEEQIPQIVVNVRIRRKTMEPLEPTRIPWAQRVA